MKFSLLFLIFCFCTTNFEPVSFKELSRKLEESLKKNQESSLAGSIIEKFSEKLDAFIGGVFVNHGVGTQGGTKVVPVYSFSQKTVIGGAQVSGPQNLLEKVKAVFQIESEYQRGTFKIKSFVPTTSVEKLERVDGVGVTAVIDHHVR